MVCSGRSRFSDKGGAAGHPDPEIRGSPVSKKIFPALQASVRSKNKAAPPRRPSAGTATGVCGKHSHIVSMLLIIRKKKTLMGLKIYLCPCVKSSVKTLLHEFCLFLSRVNHSKNAIVKPPSKIDKDRKDNDKAMRRVKEASSYIEDELDPGIRLN